MARFSATLICGNTRRPSGQWAMPWASTLRGSVPVMSRPAKWMLPERAGMSPETARSVVDLPAPLAPTNATSCPSSTLSESPFRAVTVP